MLDYFSFGGRMGKKDGSTKAYRNHDFLDSPQARTVRILSEYLEPMKRLNEEQVFSTVVFFGSSRAQSPCDEAQRKVGSGGHSTISDYYNEARELARLITEWSSQMGKPEHHLVICTGGGPGIMEAANRGALDISSAKTIGMNVSLKDTQLLNPYISPNLGFEFHYFFMRKFFLIQRALAHVFFPGGYGTMDELMEVLTLMQTGKIPHRPTVIYGTAFWKKVLNLDEMVRWGVIDEKELNLFRFADTPRDALEYIKKSLDSNSAPTWD